MTLGGCPSCGMHPHHAIGCPTASGVYVHGPLGEALRGRTYAPFYPCSNGFPEFSSGGTRGWHHFEAGPTGVICCIRCGAVPTSASTPPESGA